MFQLQGITLLCAPGKFYSGVLKEGRGGAPLEAESQIQEEQCGTVDHLYTLESEWEFAQ